uniref:Uncharacterized protein n=1 Tax=Cryptomonas curvata TaxID=233186 RepID=A0A7S0QR22_9CRYP
MAGHFLFMEDDFLVCPHALRALAYVTAKAHAYFPEGWSGIRVSYGLCGILLLDADVTAVADYLEQHQARRPPDHLLPEWIAGETPQARAFLQGRRNLGYRFNVLRHIGVTSSLREAHQVGFPGCYEELVFPVVFEAEAWRPQEPACLSDDLWPCKGAPGWPRAWPLHNVAAKGAQFLDAGAAHHRVAYVPPHEA